MCLSIPHKIISIKGQKAKVECGKKTHTLNIHLVPKVKVGDYVMNEGEYAVEKVSKKEADKTYKLLSDIKIS